MEKTIIIAEAGVNHNGSISIAKKLIDIASECGVDYIKFQTFKTEHSISKNARKAQYQIENSSNDKETQYEMVKKLELSFDQFIELSIYCKEKKVKFLSTAFDFDSLEFLSNLGIEICKIPSGEITNLPYLRKAASFFSEVIISTGMAMLSEIEDALNVFLSAGITKDNITILHCNTEYPTPLTDVNLRAMLHLKNTFGTKVGYSDHTQGIEVPVAAVALGATVIEKHFTLDKTMKGPDHKASLEPNELKSMVSAIRNIEKAISGSGTKEVTFSEQKNIAVARKSIVAKKNIQVGDVFSEENITVKRPGTGISPMQWDNVLGKYSKKDFEPDELITL